MQPQLRFPGQGYTTYQQENIDQLLINRYDEMNSLVRWHYFEPDSTQVVDEVARKTLQGQKDRAQGLACGLTNHFHTASSPGKILNLIKKHASDLDHIALNAAMNALRRLNITVNDFTNDEQVILIQQIEKFTIHATYDQEGEKVFSARHTSNFLLNIGSLKIFNEDVTRWLLNRIRLNPNQFSPMDVNNIFIFFVKAHRQEKEIFQILSQRILDDLGNYYTDNFLNRVIALILKVDPNLAQSLKEKIAAKESNEKSNSSNGVPAKNSQDDDDNFEPATNLTTIKVAVGFFPPPPIISGRPSQNLAPIAINAATNSFINQNHQSIAESSFNSRELVKNNHQKERTEQARMLGGAFRKFSDPYIVFKLLERESDGLDHLALLEAMKSLTSKFGFTIQPSQCSKKHMELLLDQIRRFTVNVDPLYKFNHPLTPEEISTFLLCLAKLKVKENDIINDLVGKSATFIDKFSPNAIVGLLDYLELTDQRDHYLSGLIESVVIESFNKYDRNLLASRIIPYFSQVQLPGVGRRILQLYRQKDVRSAQGERETTQQERALQISHKSRHSPLSIGSTPVCFNDSPSANSQTPEDLFNRPAI